VLHHSLARSSNDPDRARSFLRTCACVTPFADFYSTNSIFVFTVLAIDRSVKIMYSVKEWANIVPTSVAPGFDAYAPSKPTCTNPIYPMSPSVMPTLNQVCQFTFNWTYSCSQGPKGNNAYNGSGLFLSQQALTYNSPDLFYNGYGCSDPTNPPLAGNYFQVSGNPNGASVRLSLSLSLSRSLALALACSVRHRNTFS